MTEKAAAGKSRKKLIIIIIIIAAVVAVGIFFYFRLQAMAGQVSADVPETFALAKTSLESKVTASGNFASMDPVTVGSNVQGGEVATVYVDEGSQVNKGDMLAQLKTEDILRSISDTNSAISDARKGDSQNLDSAQRAFNDANDAYYANDRQTKDAVAKAQDAITAAQTAADAAQTAAATAKTASDAAQKALSDAKAAYDSGDPNVTQADITALQADADTKATAASAAADAAAKAEADLTSANNALDQANQQRENTMRTSNSQWYDAQAKLNSLQGVDSAKNQVSQLQTLNEDLANASITSPVTGIVTSVNTQAGQATNGNMFVVEDTETLQITASVAEYDVIKIQDGMKVHITSNATGDEEYDGVVNFVAPIASDSNGNFDVKVLLTSPAGQLKPGMTATVEIVTESKDNVFAVPIDAVVTKADGTKVVYAYEPEGGQAIVRGGGNGGGPGNAGGGPAAANGGPTTTNGGPATTGGGDSTANASGGGNAPVAINGGNGPGNAGGGAGRVEIPVQTGMETDYYIEISGDGLQEGMLILSDPLGLNVSTNNGSALSALAGARQNAGGGSGRTNGGGQQANVVVAGPGPNAG